jgi:F-type H+-transporting ATPase subunit epsilon
MSNQKIKFKIITPERTVFEEEIDQATLPVTNGEVTILPNHRSYIATLKSGEILLKKANEEISLAISRGFVEFNKNNLVILADTAEKAEEIDIQLAEEAKKRAENLKKEKISMNDEEYARAAAAIMKEMARVKVAKKYRTRTGIKID